MINGYIVNAEEVSSSTSRNVGYLVYNLSQFRLAISIAKKSSFSFYIYCPCDDFDRRGINPPENVKLVMTSKSFESVLYLCELLIVSVGHRSPVLPDWYMQIVNLAKSISMKIIEVPHGLLQWGYNFRDDSALIDYASYDLGGGWLDCFADRQINFIGENSVGYPETVNPEVDSVVVPEYTVVTTNTNWFMYNEEAQRTFYISFFDFAESLPEELFIWCPHPAELREQNFANHINSHKPKNIYIYGLDKEIFFEGLHSTEDVISRAARGISTISTCLVQYFFSQIPVVVVPTKGFQNLEQLFESASISNNLWGLESSQFQKLRLSKCGKFDGQLFDKLINQLLVG